MILNSSMIPPVNSAKNTQNPQNFAKTNGENSNFGQYIDNATKLHFSKHANQRLEMRNISLSANQMERLNEGVLKAESKGIKDGLVILDNLALLISISNKTVITAADDAKVFTNIDGAVIA